MRSRLLVVAAALALLCACTGTFEPRPPTLLVVGAAPGGAPRLLLVEDVSATAPRGEPRLEVVPAAARPLLAPAVAIDFEDRSGDRDAAWVLVRSVGDAGGGYSVTSHLQRFTVADVDPSDPAAFAEDTAARVTLTEPGGTGVLDGLSLTSPATCPVALQVDREGTTAVVLDVPATCGSSDHPELWLVPLDGEEPFALQGTNDVASLPAYLDQRPVDQVVYFLVDGINSTHVYRHVLGASSSERLEDRSVPQPAARLRSAAGTGDRLVVLGEAEIHGVRLVEEPEVTRAGTRTGTVDLVVDHTGVTTEVLVLTTTAVAFHTNLEDGSPDTVPGQRFAATIDPATRFAYAVADGSISILDLLSGGETDNPFRSHLEPLAEVELPTSGVGASPMPVSVIAWVRAAAPPEP